MGLLWQIANFTGLILVDILGIVTVLLLMVIAYYKWTFQYWKRRGVPYIEPKIPFGSYQAPHKRVISFSEEYMRFYTDAKSKGWRHCGLYSLITPVYYVLDIELVKKIMSTDFHYFSEKGIYYNDKDDPIGSHLFSLGGARWRHLRTMLTPTFTSGKLKMMFHLLLECGREMEKYLEKNIDDKLAIDAKDALERFTTDIIGTSAFGLGCNSFKEPDSPFRLKAMKFFRLTRLGALRTAFVNNCPNLARTLTFRTISKDVGDFFGKVIEDTVNYRENNGVVRRDFLQLLIDIKNGVGQEENGEKGDKKTLTMSEIAAQSFIFFLAGYETSSATMTFALYQLAINPDIQDRVREEIETVLSKHNGEMTYEAVTEFKYMEQVINETLRLYPPLPMILRSCSADYKVPGENLVIEKGTRVHIPVMGIHYDEEYYENPYCFDPDRFSEENKKKIKKYTYMPFGEGPRICIGMRFGLMQSKIGLASILRKFRVTLNERTKLPLTFCKTSVFINAEGGVWLNLEKIRS